MNGEIVEILHVDGNGEICIKCFPCDINRMIKAPKGKHKISVRCKKCGTNNPFKINWRKGPRKDYWERIYVKCNQVSTLDLSTGGISFERKEDMDIPLGAEIVIELPLSMVRKDVFLQPIEIEIVSRQTNRYGAKFLNLADESKAKKRIASWLMVR